jgi:serine/threonine protein kinase
VEIRTAIGGMSDYAVPVERVLFHPIFFKSGPLPKNEFISITDSIPKDSAIAIFPFAGDLDLFGMVQAHYSTRTTFSKEVLAQYTKELIHGIKQLHSKGIAHRDIKPENIMLGGGKLRFIDFGFACFYAKCAGRKGTPFYMAPEIYKQPQIKDWDKADIFALGNTLFFIMTVGQNVIHSDADDTQLNNVFQRYFSTTDIKDVREDIQNRINSTLTGSLAVFIPLIIGMTDPDENVRWSAIDCDKWVTDNK